jgi:hypothetical protein
VPFTGSSSTIELPSGPQSIGTRVRSDSVLLPGMVLSDGSFVSDDEQRGHAQFLA